jgi:4-hydroxy-3-methylbut-2-enyl diphosphate reductase
VGKRRIGITAGASAPEVLVQALLARLDTLGVKRVRKLEGIEEHIQFPLPKGLSGPAPVSVAATPSAQD